MGKAIAGRRTKCGRLGQAKTDVEERRARAGNAAPPLLMHRQRIRQFLAHTGHDIDPSDSRCGSQLGALLLFKRINSAEYAAGIRWFELLDQYDGIFYRFAGLRTNVRSVALDARSARAQPHDVMRPVTAATKSEALVVGTYERIRSTLGPVLDRALERLRRDALVEQDEATAIAALKLLANTQT
jgi:hypothetical protein